MSRSLPNIVVVVLDSVRKDHVSCYGHERPTTPNLDRIAVEGILFENAYATSCWTLPSHASLFTGLYPSQHRADFDTKYLDPKHATIAEVLRARGYRTACISCNGFISDHTNLDEGFELAVDAGRLHGGGDGRRSRLVRGVHRRWRQWTARDRGAGRATKLAFRWLAERERGKPFFLFMNYMECHLPYGLRMRERHRFVAPRMRRRVDRVPQDPFACMAGKVRLTEQEIADLQALYDGSLYYLDQQIGRLDLRLRQLGLDDETVFIVTSDHGESFGDHGLFDHQYGLYEHLISAPLVIRLPGRDRAGWRVSAFVQHTDLLPAILRWIDGSEASLQSGSALFEGSAREVVVAEYLVPNVAAIRRRFPDADVSRLDVPMRSIREGPFKLIERRVGQAELYDLSVDPHEAHDVAAARPEVVGRLRSRLESVVGPWPDSTSDAEGAAAPVELHERLEALGYL